MSKTFASKSISHIESYSLVKKTEDFVLSFLLLQVFTTYALALTNYLNSNFVSKVPFFANNLAFLDDKFDLFVLGSVDKGLALILDYKKKGEDAVAAYKKKGGDLVGAYKKKGEEIVTPYKKKGEEIVGSYKQKGEEIVASYKKKGGDIVAPYKKKGEDIVKKGEETVASYLKPVNDYASSTVDKVLPKAKNAADKAEKTTETEIAKSLEIVNDTLERSKDLLSTKSSELSNAVISTYNEEFDAVKEKNYYVKVASASVTTGVKLLKSVNSDYIQPLKTTTQSYVSDVAAQTKSKAELVVASVEELAPSQPTLNGSAPVVSASA